MKKDAKDIQIGCLIEFDYGDMSLTKKSSSQSQKAIGLVSGIDENCVQILYFQNGRANVSNHGFYWKNLNYKVLSAPIKDKKTFLESLNGQSQDFILKIIEEHELVDPQEVYPDKERIDYNGLNEGSVEYTMEQLTVATIRCHLALGYYETIFKLLPKNEYLEPVEEKPNSILDKIKEALEPIESSDPLGMNVEIPKWEYLESEKPKKKSLTRIHSGTGFVSNTN